MVPLLAPDTIGAVFTGLTGLVAALAAYAANRGRRTAVDVHSLRSRVRRLEQMSAAAVGHVFQLELVLSGHGFPVPPRPRSLEQFYADAEKDEEYEKGEKGDPARAAEELRYDQA